MSHMHVCIVFQVKFGVQGSAPNFTLTGTGMEHGTSELQNFWNIIAP